MIRARVLGIPLAGVLVACAAGASTLEPAPIPVVMSEYSYGTQVIDAPSGRPIRFAARNAGKVEHDLVIVGLPGRVILQAGQSGELTIGPLAPGAYVVHCTIPTHRELGMLATLLVR